MPTPYRLTATFWDHATIWSDDESLAGHSTEGGRVFGITRTRYAECDHYGCHAVAVIDPENPAAARRLLETYGRQFTDWTPELDSNVTRLQAALREFADPKPPKPAEPIGLGAVVEAVYDNRFVHIGGGIWQRVGDSADPGCKYADIDTVRVLSEGVTS